MDRREALQILEPTIKLYEAMATIDGDTSGAEYVEAYKMAVADMRKMQYLEGRPCEVCSCHNEKGCGVLNCMFDGKDNV